MHKRYKGKRNGQRLNYKYRPQRRLIARLASELSMSEINIVEQIKTERLYLLQEIYGSDIKKWEI
jgi:hypothetical protein